MKPLQFVKKHKTQLDLASRYFRLLMILGGEKGIHLPPREIDLLAYTAVKGTISTKPAKDEFVSLYKSSTATLNNLISSLTEKKMLYKDKNMIRVHPSIRPRFQENKSISMLINLSIDDLQHNRTDTPANSTEV